MSTQYRLVQLGKTASGGCSAGPRFIRACSATDLFIYLFIEASNVFLVYLINSLLYLVLNAMTNTNFKGLGFVVFLSTSSQTLEY
jgi:hypothetical protein